MDVTSPVEITMENTAPKLEDLEPFNKPYVTSRNGEKISHLDLGKNPLIVRHNDVQTSYVNSVGCWQDQVNNPKIMGFEAYMCDFGSEYGVDDTYTHPLARDLGAACVRMGDFYFDHVAMYGFIDTIHPEHGEMILHHVIFGPMYHDLKSRHQGGGDAHNDPFQPRPSFPGWEYVLMDLVRFDSWTFEKGKAWDSVGDMSVQPATSGAINFKGAGSKNVTIQRFLLTGNWYQNYVQNAEKPRGMPTNICMRDGIMERTRPNYGVHRIMNCGPSQGTSGGAEIQWENVRDLKSGELIDVTKYGGLGAGRAVPVKGTKPVFVKRAISDGGDGPPPPPPPPPPEGMTATFSIPKQNDPPLQPGSPLEYKATVTGGTPVVSVQVKHSDGEIVVVERDKITSVEGDLDWSALRSGTWIFQVKDDDGQVVDGPSFTIVPVKEPELTVLVPRIVLEALLKDLTAIRNNSRSTEGDPWERLKSNVGRASTAVERLESILK